MKNETKKKVIITITDIGGGIASINKKISGLNNLELVGLYTSLLNELNQTIIAIQNAFEK